MGRTINEIAGSYGLSYNADNSPVSTAEQSVLDSVKRAVDQMKSISTESAAGRGMGRSSFTEGYQALQEKDLYAGALSDIAQNRLGFEQGLIGYGVQGDIASDARTAEALAIKDQNKQDMINNFYGNLITNAAGGIGDYINSFLNPKKEATKEATDLSVDGVKSTIEESVAETLKNIG